MSACERYEADLSALLDGELDAERETALRAHMADCPDCQALYDAFPVKRSPTEWAFRWLCNHPQIATVLSGWTRMLNSVTGVQVISPPHWILISLVQVVFSAS